MSDIETPNTEPSGTKTWAEWENLARSQWQLSDAWEIESAGVGITLGIEDKIDQLEADNELSDYDRWRDLVSNPGEFVMLPKHVMWISMTHKAGDQIARKFGFITLETTAPDSSQDRNGA